jgi:SAM-dependent methyltransferase
MVARNARILDAGCGPGRVGGALARAGHDVVGVDVDPALIEAAEQDHPGPRWLVGDLAELDLPARGVTEPFDAIVCAGNVMTFLAPNTRIAVLSRFRAHLAVDGRAVLGFGAGRGYEFEEFRQDVAAAGLEPELMLSTWDLRPLTKDADFLVALLRPAQPQ